MPVARRHTAALSGAAGTGIVLYIAGRITDGAGARRAAPPSGPGLPNPWALPGGPPRAGGSLILSGRAGPSATVPGARSVSLRPPAASLPCLPLWRRPWSGVFILCGSDLVVAGLSGPSSDEHSGGPHPGPGASTPL